MSNDLEVVVRPSGSIDYAPAKVYFTPGQVGVPNTILRIGGGNGTPKVLLGSYSAHSTSYMTQYTNEKKTAHFGTAF